MLEEIPAKTLGESTNEHVNAWREYQATKPLKERVYCANWDDQNMVAHVLAAEYPRTRIIGVLQPVDYDMVARSPGIQPWSKR